MKHRASQQQNELQFTSVIAKKIELEKEYQAAENSCNVLQNELAHQNQKVQNVKSIIALLQATLDQKNIQVQNHKSYVKSLHRRQEEERIAKEELEVQNYH